MSILENAYRECSNKSALPPLEEVRTNIRHVYEVQPNVKRLPFFRLSNVLDPNLLKRISEKSDFFWPFMLGCGGTIAVVGHLLYDWIAKGRSRGLTIGNLSSDLTLFLILFGSLLVSSWPFFSASFSANMQEKTLDKSYRIRLIYLTVRFLILFFILLSVAWYSGLTSLYFY